MDARYPGAKNKSLYDHRRTFKKLVSKITKSLSFNCNLFLLLCDNFQLSIAGITCRDLVGVKYEMF
jgi:hypothetical protein